MIPRVLAIAGSDSGGGAGIQADIKTITMLGGHAMTAVTALTAQNTLGVSGVLPVPAEMVIAQVDAVVADIGVDAVKIGMIGAAATALTVAERLVRPDLAHAAIVFDPVMIATSGAVLADADTVRAFAALMDVAGVVTPNTPELAALSGMAVEDEAGMVAAARLLARRHDIAVVAKGGHLDGADVADLLVTAEGEPVRHAAARIDTSSTHGTGCTLSSAIATGLAASLSLADAFAQARAYVRAALFAAPGLGRGHGPMGHGLDRAHFPATPA
ncbi:bifunctional hydroxymethylpyrimidine kinase/phosphomethylpyrimidine kinase [uncultured Sphingomonas sp.]|uniref:bifunctional hydroxymethylpyrimidine kinase/phosphomethylpyrimidine kinase n=1 Tax=uncultured Sphingomonas sp. TaxID=158754 RepID=UPI0025DF6775|nr:bifunctional hydroxymethylpyrimidine kinase/phosphomethylpyrimidine kinase [uncultured Sphingomonas sp.]